MKIIGKTACIALVLSLVLSVSAARAASGKRISAMTEFAAQAAEHAASLDDAYSVPCDWALVEELKKTSSTGQGTLRLAEILLQSACVRSFSVGWYDHEVYLANITYYPGWRIFRLWESGKTDALSPRERQTLDRALELVSGASGSDLEKERYFYDTLCARVTYDYRDDGSGEKDCAVGALLNGRADCDGYSDAMLLCCSLSGIPCRLIHGRALQAMQPGSGESSHLWNLVYVAGSWLICDVTWGDQERGPSYLYFNLGRQDASLSYHWNADTLFTEIARAADFDTQLMPDQRPAVVRSQEDVYEAARAASLAGSRTLTLYSPEAAPWTADEDTFMKMLRCGGFNSFSYRDSGRWYELSNIVLPENAFRFCDTEVDFLSAAEAYRDTGVTTFSLFFEPALADRLFAGSHEELQRLITESCIQPDKPYYYSTENGSVTFRDASFR